MSRLISIFGATGSIGDSMFSLLRQMDERPEIEVISGHQNGEKLSELAHEFRPKLVVCADDVELDLPEGVGVAKGSAALEEAASREVDWALNAVIGAAGLPVSLALAQSAKWLALANKESLVAGGTLLKAKCQRSGTTLLPVDSEHSAIFQCLLGQDMSALDRIILTASGGPFREFTLEEMEDVTLEQALAHPVWSMGARITIDSASMFNKALEMIEAKELFSVTPEQIEVIVHPQSIVHSLVEFKDQGLLAQLGVPDMRHAIGFAYGYPKRLHTDFEKLDLAALGALRFEAPDETRFPALAIAREVMEMGGVSGAAFNGAKEAALTRFFDAEIGFLDMARIVADVIEKGDWKAAPDDLSVIMDADLTAREMARSVRV